MAALLTEYIVVTNMAFMFIINLDLSPSPTVVYFLLSVQCWLVGNREFDVGNGFFVFETCIFVHL